MSLAIGRHNTLQQPGFVVAIECMVTMFLRANMSYFRAALLLLIASLTYILVGAIVNYRKLRVIPLRTRS